MLINFLYNAYSKIMKAKMQIREVYIPLDFWDIFAYNHKKHKT